MWKAVACCPCSLRDRSRVLCAIRPADRGGVTGPALSGIWLPCRQANGLKAGTSVRQDAPCKGHGHVVLLLARAFQPSVPFRSWKRLIARRLPPLAARSLPTDQNILPTMRDEERYSSSRPLKEFHGNEDDYPDWETDFETWSVRRGYDRHLEMEDPRERDRVWASYTVSRNDDPLGPIGARIYRESPSEMHLLLAHVVP